jgi:hypothetical protein
MTAREMLNLHEDGDRTKEHHPMSVLDLDTSPHDPDGSRYRAPKLILENSIGHIFESQLPKSLDPVSGISTYMLVCEKGTQTNWVVEFTGTAQCYTQLLGSTRFFIVPYTALNHQMFRDWDESDKTQ